MIQSLFRGWHWMRLIRLVLGSLMVGQFFQTGDKLIGIVGALLLFQALFNKGCCANNTCAPAPKNLSQNKQTEEISFEEIK